MYCKALPAKQQNVRPHQCDHLLKQLLRLQTTVAIANTPTQSTFQLVTVSRNLRQKVQLMVFLVFACTVAFVVFAGWGIWHLSQHTLCDAYTGSIALNSNPKLKRYQVQLLSIMHKATELIQKSVDQKGHTVFLHEKGLFSLQRANMVSFRYSRSLIVHLQDCSNNADQAFLEKRNRA